jgi:hypothetical protein
MRVPGWFALSAILTLDSSFALCRTLKKKGQHSLCQAVADLAPQKATRCADRLQLTISTLEPLPIVTAYIARLMVAVNKDGLVFQFQH